MVRASLKERLSRATKASRDKQVSLVLPKQTVSVSKKLKTSVDDEQIVQEEAHLSGRPVKKC